MGSYNYIQKGYHIFIIGLNYEYWMLDIVLHVIQRPKLMCKYR